MRFVLVPLAGGGGQLITATGEGFDMARTKMRRVVGRMVFFAMHEPSDVLSGPAATVALNLEGVPGLVPPDDRRVSPADREESLRLLEEAIIAKGRRCGAHWAARDATPAELAALAAARGPADDWPGDWGLDGLTRPQYRPDCTDGQMLAWMIRPAADGDVAAAAAFWREALPPLDLPFRNDPDFLYGFALGAVDAAAAPA